MAKVRNGFVSNSSSSSFTCDICGETVSGMGACLEDAEMYECENGHTNCEEHIIDNISQEALREIMDKQIAEAKSYFEDRPERIEEIDEFIKDEYIRESGEWKEIDLNDINYFCGEFDLEDMRYYLPEQMCPLCNFEEIDNGDMMSYLIKTRGISADEVFTEIKAVNKRRKKLRPEEYVMYVCNKKNLTVDTLLQEVDEKFNGSYKEFLSFLREK